MKTLAITVETKGKTTVETKGFTGESCRETSRFVELALGRATAETLTTEFYTQATEGERLRQPS